MKVISICKECYGSGYIKKFFILRRKCKFCLGKGKVVERYHEKRGL